MQNNLAKNEDFACMPELTKKDWIEVAEIYKKKANFPHCLGAIDGKHIRIRKPINTGSEYFNYKNYFSIVLMAVVDANYKFLIVDIGAYGKGSDSLVFQDSNFGQRLQRDELDLPQASIINGYNGPVFPYVFLADEAFPLSNRIMRPYGGHNLSIDQRIYNYRLSRGRRFVECAFGILANKWRLFHTPITLEPENVTHVVKAACVLHNFIRVRDGVNFEDATSYQDFHDVEFPNGTQRLGRTVRDNFATYFMSPEGELPWQMSKI